MGARVKPGHDGSATTGAVRAITPLSFRGPNEVRAPGIQ
jgi:hypothetical protein